MNITLTQLEYAVKQCTPGAPDTYARRLWRELQGICECDAGGNVPHLPHSQRPPTSGWDGFPAAGGSVIR